MNHKFQCQDLKQKQTSLNIFTTIAFHGHMTFLRMVKRKNLAKMKHNLCRFMICKKFLKLEIYFSIVNVNIVRTTVFVELISNCQANKNHISLQNENSFFISSSMKEDQFDTQCRSR